MQVYDRVIPTQSTATLWVLTVGVLLSVLMELVVKIAARGSWTKPSRHRFATLQENIRAAARYSHGPAPGERGDPFRTTARLTKRSIVASSVKPYFTSPLTRRLRYCFLIAIAFGRNENRSPCRRYSSFVAVGVGLYYRRRSNCMPKAATLHPTGNLGCS